MITVTTERRAGTDGAAGSSRAGDPPGRAFPIDAASVGLVLAVVVGLVLRILWVHYATRTPEGLFDPARYLGFAEKIARGQGYTEPITGNPTAYYPPGYPYFLGAIGWVGRHTPLTDHIPLAAGYVQAVLGALTAGAAGVVGRRLFSPLAGVVAAAAVALWPSLIFYSASLLTETLYNALFVGSLAALCWRPWSAGLSTRRLIVFAALFGGAVLVRPISLAVVPVLVGVWWYQEREWAPALRRLGVTVAVLLVLAVPWTIRNAVQMDSFVVMSTNTGDNLCIGHQPEADGSFKLTDNCKVEESFITRGPKGEVAHDNKARNLAFKYLGANWTREPWLLTQRAYYMFEHDHDSVYAVQSYYCYGLGPSCRWMDRDTENTFISLADGYYAVASVLGLAGLVVAVWFRRPDRLLLVGSAVATVAVPLALFGDPRFKAPVLPLLAIALGALVALPALRRERASARSARDTAAGAAV